jgi:hypothetical protein
MDLHAFRLASSRPQCVTCSRSFCQSTQRAEALCGVKDLERQLSPGEQEGDRYVW